MKAFLPKKTIALITAALMLLACGGGSSIALLAGGGIDGTGIISQGPIAFFGSIVLNGSEFDTIDAEVIVDGESVGFGDQAVLDHLMVGMVVTVEGSYSDNNEDLIAQRVIYNETLRGPVVNIQTIDATTKELTVLGQSVIINALTEFYNTTFNSLALDDVITISGFFDGLGAIRASFVGIPDVPEPLYEVSGVVSDLDPLAETFQISDLLVDYSTADLSALPDEALSNGLFVEVEGSLDMDNDVLDATEVEPGEVLEAETAAEIEIIGFVTDATSGFDFRVGTQGVSVEDDALFVDGMPDDVAIGVKLEAEGRLEDGILIAEEVEFWGPDQIEVEGVITDFVSPSEFTVGDQLVQTDDDTVFENGSPDDLGLGIEVEIKGVPNDIDRSILFADKVSFEQEEE